MAVPAKGQVHIGVQVKQRIGIGMDQRHDHVGFSVGFIAVRQLIGDSVDGLNRIAERH